MQYPTSEITLQLDKLPHEHYLPGEQVKCKVMLKVDENIQIQSISVQFKGRAKTFWTNETLDCGIEEFNGHEQYFSSFQYIFGVQNGPQQLVKPGIYAFDCHYRLPSHLPDSMKSLYGQVVYSVNVQVQTNSHEIKQKEVLRDFRVLSQLDLNNYPNLKCKVDSLTKEIYGCQCCSCITLCKSRVIDMLTVVPCGGYVPGDKIPIFIEIDNNSKKSMESVLCEFYEIMTFTTLEPRLDTKKVVRLLWEHKFNGIPAGENRFFQTNLTLKPEYEFKVLYGCGIIDVKYFIKTTGVIFGHPKQVKNEIELMIGTKPFDDAETLKNNVKKDISMKKIIRGSMLDGDSSDATSEKTPLIPKKN
ncbi:arrestin domain-containing protein 17-like [Culicoides brevitarsis]|uniref:arrestin domain-containing protein 17-like n=1 Tax=Culicoides brevitarsis TaxID=469753 RepID=UPI00307B9249